MSALLADARLVTRSLGVFRVYALGFSWLVLCTVGAWLLLQTESSARNVAVGVAALTILSCPALLCGLVLSEGEFEMVSPAPVRRTTVLLLTGLHVTLTAVAASAAWVLGAPFSGALLLLGLSHALTGVGFISLPEEVAWLPSAILSVIFVVAGDVESSPLYGLAVWLDRVPALPETAAGIGVLLAAALYAHRKLSGSLSAR